MKRNVLFWLVAAVAFWGWMFAADVGRATTALVFSTLLGVGIAVGLLSFHIIRARLGR
jgi:hypothetical protein